MSISMRRAFVVALTIAPLTTVAGPASAAEPASPAAHPMVVEPAPDDGIESLDEFSEETAATPPAADVSVDRWLDVGGQSLGDVPYQLEPNETDEVFGDLDAPMNVGNDYAIRMRTLLTPETSGTYRFWISGDDDMRLFLNSNGDDPAGAERIAYIAGWTTYQQWTRFWSQRSVWIDLEAGTPYYLEMIGKEGSGDDHFSVAWEMADGFVRQQISADVIEATNLGSGGWRSSTPAGLPDTPAALTDPAWTVSAATESLTVGWSAVDDAEWYEVRLEGSGQSRDVIVDEPTVVFENLVPETRYLVEVAPASPAGRQPATGRVFMTQSGPYPTPVAPAPGDEPTVAYDRWDTGWWTLTSVPTGLDPASTTTLSTGLEAPPMQGDNHATRLRAVITPTQTDDYTFHLAGDDDARLLFNPNGPFAHGATPVAYVSGWTEQYQWDRYDSQETPTFELVAGESYYIEAIGVHAFGLDHLEVGWSTPGGEIEVVPADVLAPTMSGTSGWREDAGSLAVPPGIVRNLGDAWNSASSVQIGWDAPLVNDDAGVALHYVISIDGAGLADEVAVTATTVGFDGLTPGNEYTVQVTAVNGVGVGPVAWHAVEHPVVASTTTSTTTTTTTTAAPSTSSTSTTTTTVPATTTTTTTTTPPTTTTTTVPDDGGRPITSGFAILALADHGCGGLQLSGSSIDVFGGLRSNTDVMVQGSDVDIDGVISYATTANVSSAVRSDGAVRDRAPVASNLDWTVADFATGSPIASIPYFRHNGYWWVGGSVEPGIHYVDGNVQISASQLDLDGVTIVATGTIGISGSGLELGPAAPELPTILSGETNCYRTGVNLSASSINWTGVIAAPGGRVQVNGSNLIGGEILAAAVQMSGSNIELGRTEEVMSAGVDTGNTSDTTTPGGHNGHGTTGKRPKVVVDSGEPVARHPHDVLKAAKKAAKSVRAAC